MKTISEIKADKQKKVDELLTNTGVFFAFSNEQFQKNKTPLKEGEKYVSIGAGGYIPKGNLDLMLNGMEAIDKQYKADIKNNKARKANIIYELSNHEAWDTGDITDTVFALGEGYTAAEVMQVYRSNYAEHSASF